MLNMLFQRKVSISGIHIIIDVVFYDTIKQMKFPFLLMVRQIWRCLQKDWLEQLQPPPSLPSPSPPLQKKIVIIICEKEFLQFYDLLLKRS